MKNLKAVLKIRNEATAKKVGQILQEHEMEIFRLSRYGVYFNANENTLKEFFGCVFSEDDNSLKSFEIPNQLSSLVEAIYEPTRPKHFEKKS